MGIVEARKKKAPIELNVKRVANGGYIVRHAYDNSGAGESYQPSTEHAFTSHAEVMKHIGKHLGGHDQAPASPKPAPSKRAAPTVATAGAEMD